MRVIWGLDSLLVEAGLIGAEDFITATRVRAQAGHLSRHSRWKRERRDKVILLFGMGYGGLFAWGVEAYEDGRGISFDGFEASASQLGSECLVVGAGEVGAEIFTGGACFEVAVEEALDGVGAVLCGGTEADLASDAGVLADRTSDAEVEGVDHLAILLDFFAFKSDVCDPALSAGVGAAGDVDADLLVESGETLFEF